MSRLTKKCPARLRPLAVLIVLMVMLLSCFLFTSPASANHVDAVPSSTTSPDPVIKPQGKVGVDCKGAGEAVLDNSKSTTAWGFELVINGQAELYQVGAGKSPVVSFASAKPGSTVVVQDEAGELDSAVVPKKCDKIVIGEPKSIDLDDSPTTLPNTGGPPLWIVGLGFLFALVGLVVVSVRGSGQNTN